MTQPQPADRELAPLPFHAALREYLQQQEADLWRWFASNRVRTEQAEATRFDLLKSTYRIDRQTQPKLYQAAEEVAASLNLQVPITLYQGQSSGGLNAALAFVPGEAHVVLYGPLTKRLSGEELRALLAHELSHQLLWEGWEGEYLIVDQIVSALSVDRLAEPTHFATARLWSLYNEVFCDRGSLSVVQHPEVVVSALIKTQTDLEDVSAANYLRQVEEIFAAGTVETNELTHRETIIRARAIQLWHETAADLDATIRDMIEGQPALAELDLLTRHELTGWTRKLIDALLAPKWMQTGLTLGQARLYFDDYAPPPASCDPPESFANLPIAARLQRAHPTVCDYCCYVLLDFVTADRDLEELPIAAALELAERLQLKDRFCELARKELRLRKKQLEDLDEQKLELLAKVGPPADAS